MSWTANLNVKAQNQFIKSQTLATLETLFLSNYKSAANGFCKFSNEIELNDLFSCLQMVYYLNLVKFVFSKKATKIDKIFTVDLTLTT